MIQREDVEKAINTLHTAGIPGADKYRDELNTLIEVAQLYLAAEKGMPEKRYCIPKEEHCGRANYGKRVCAEHVGRNDAIDDCTAYITAKLAGLEGVIIKHGRLSIVSGEFRIVLGDGAEDKIKAGETIINVGNLADAIRAHIMKKEG
jgi:hypothetical protein